MKMRPHPKMQVHVYASLNARPILTTYLVTRYSMPYLDWVIATYCLIDNILLPRIVIR